MKIHIVLAMLLCTSCAANAGRVDAGVFPPNEYGSQDTDTTALAEIDRVIQNGHRPETPQKAAHVLASVEYLAGAYNTSVRWIGLPGFGPIRILQGREEVREVLGVRPGTPSQVVIDTLLAASRTTDDASLLKALDTPVLTRGPQQTAAILRNLPDFPATLAGIRNMYQSIYRFENPVYITR